jgi:hypothetical protein
LNRGIYRFTGVISMEGIVNTAMQSISLRLIVVGVIVMLPVGLSTAWLGAGYQHEMWQADFEQTVTGLMLSGTPTVFAVGYLLLYPLERWFIRDRALHSGRWLLVRMLLYILASVPIGAALLWSIRLGVRTYPALVESSYFVITVTNVCIFGILYSLLERALAEMQQREAKLKQEIAELRIEIDQAKRARHVQEITETDYFRGLQTRAEQMRERRRHSEEGAAAPD